MIGPVRRWTAGVSAACLLAALAAGCAAPRPAPTQEADPDALTAGTVSRRPPAGLQGMARRQQELGLEALLTPDGNGCLDLRAADLRQADLAGLGDPLLNADFDSDTLWPDALPGGFDPEAMMELGKDPGLGVRALHEQGVTGRGVGIAIIDQTLLTEHQEYADRLRLYQEYNTVAESAELHGAAVASIALGGTVGVAPEALLYYIADQVGHGDGGNFVRDMSDYARDIDRFIALNDTLPEEEKIRVISMSVGYMADTQGAQEMDAAIARARAAGIAVVWVSDDDPLMSQFTGAGRAPVEDPNDIRSVRPGRFWTKYLYDGTFGGTDSLLVPMDRRTTASPSGAADYAYYVDGGMSWAVPYVAGLYALACQVKPDVTFEEFTAAARDTARPVISVHEGKEYPFGNVVDPAALLEALGMADPASA